MSSLELLRAYATRWHHRRRDLDALSAELGAELIVRPGGRKVLGFVVAVAGIRQVVLNERLVGSPLRTPVLAHECAHLILGVQGVSLCSSVQYPGRDERNAWAGAAMLAIPDDTIPRRQSARVDLAASLGVPVELVDLRAALTEYLDSSEPRSFGGYRALSEALRCWYARFERESRLL